MRLVIVESPKKARTIKGFLGTGFQVAASMGHVRDLPPKELGVDVQHAFTPEYVVLPRAQSALASLRKAAAGAEAVLLATDPDREGEAIAWHLAQALRLPKSRYRRITFHEISRRAIQEALADPRDLNADLIDAQQARRVLDRLVGYQLSPLLWRKVHKGTSAGRVQSVAVRLIVDREREIQAFVPEEYWTIDVRLGTSPPGPLSTTLRGGEGSTFVARLKEIDGKKAEIGNAERAGEISGQLEEASYRVRETGQKTVSRNPFPPFTTSTLQQAAGNRLRLAAKKTMGAAQSLYEAGLITYMRTDSVSVAADAIAQARRVIGAEFGPEYVPPSPRRYATKAKNAQEAHEAIRPVDLTKTPASLRGSLTNEEWRVYDLIWKRMIASQMPPARYRQDTALVDGVYVGHDLTPRPPLPQERGSLTPSPTGEGQAEGQGEVTHGTTLFLLKAQASTLVFPGWLKAYGEETGEQSGNKGSAEPGSEDDGPANARLPELTEGQSVYAEDVLPSQHFTQPPRRYTEPSLVKALEDAGIGRPSTYATIVSTILDRGYVALEQRHFVPTELGFAANDFLVAHFPRIVDLPFTVEMEDSLDEIAAGKLGWTEMLGAFYGPFAQTLAKASTAPVSPLKQYEGQMTAPAADVSQPARSTRGASSGGSRRASASAATKRTRRARSTESEAGSAGAAPAGAAPAGAPSAGACPQCGKPLVERTSQYGPFKGCSGFPGCRYIQRDGQAAPTARKTAPSTRRRTSGSKSGQAGPKAPARTRTTAATRTPPSPLTKNVVRRSRRPEG